MENKPKSAARVLGLDTIDLSPLGGVDKHVEDTTNDRVILTFSSGAVLDIPSRIYVKLFFAKKSPT